MRKIKLLLFFLTIFIYCNVWNPFSPDRKNINENISKQKNTPENVIQNLQQAYSQKVLEDYLNCLSEDFIFVLRDEDQAYFMLSQNWWDKVTEERIHKKMFQEASDIELKLIPISKVEVDENQFDLKYQYQLNVYYNTTRYVADGFALFTLKKYQTDWKICRWQDLDY